VGAFADNDVALLILDLGKKFGEELDCWWIVSDANCTS